MPLTLSIRRERKRRLSFICQAIVKQIAWKFLLLYLSKVIGQMPIFPHKECQEVPWEKDYQVPKEVWILLEIQDAFYIRSHSAPLAIELLTRTEKDQMNHIKYMLGNLWHGYLNSVNHYIKNMMLAIYHENSIFSFYARK